MLSQDEPAESESAKHKEREAVRWLLCCFPHRCLHLVQDLKQDFPNHSQIRLRVLFLRRSSVEASSQPTHRSCRTHLAGALVSFNFYIRDPVNFPCELSTGIFFVQVRSISAT